MRAAESFVERFTTSNLEILYRTKVGINSNPGLDKISRSKFEESLAENIKIILRKVSNCTYRYTNYRQLLISKGKDSKPREICIPSVRDKLTLSALSQVLDDVYGTDCVTPQPQLLIDHICQQLQNRSFNAYVKIDIKGFYSSIDHDKLMHILRRKIRKTEVLGLIEGAIRTPSSTFVAKAMSARDKGVPEGLSISNKLTNIYVLDIDKAFKNRIDCAYFRYVDDILIFCNEDDLVRIQLAIESAVKNLKLELNVKKCKRGILSSEGFEFLGYVFRSNGILTVRRSSILNIENAIEGIFRQYSNENILYWRWKLNLRITGCRIEDEEGCFERYGWLHYFSRIDDISLLYHLDWLVDKLFNKYSIEKPEDVKSFRKAFYELSFKSSSTTYIPTFSWNASIEEKRRMLSEVFRELDVASLGDEEVSRLFNKRIRREAKRLERDVGRLS